jgi:hypothetical protein
MTRRTCKLFPVPYVSTHDRPQRTGQRSHGSAVTRRSHGGRTALARRLRYDCTRSHGGRTAVARPGGRMAHPQRMHDAGTPGVLAPTGAHSRRIRAADDLNPRPPREPPPPAPPPPSAPSRVPSGGCSASLCCSNTACTRRSTHNGSAARGSVSGRAGGSFAAQRLRPGRTGAGGSPD